jgi:outer membrane protein assembly factor BamA
MRALARILLGCALLVPMATRAACAAPTRLEYRGTVIGPRQVETMAAAALRTPRDSAAVAALLGDLVGRLQDLGYLAAHATAGWDSLPSPRLVVSAREGPRYHLRTLQLALPGRDDSARVAADLDLHVGTPASPRILGEAVDRAVRAALERGHPYASLGITGWSADSGAVAVRIGGEIGPEVTVSRAEVAGLSVTRPQLVQKAIGRLAGAPFRPSTAAAARERLMQLGLFRSVTLEGLASEPDPARGRVLYRVEEPKYNQFEGVVGFQGATGTVGLGRLQLDNLLGTGRAVLLRWEARGRGMNELDARYAEPLLFGTPLRLEGELAQQVEDTLDVRTRWGGSATLPISPQEKLQAGYQQERVVQAHGPLEEADLQSTLFAIERSTLDDPLGARRGVRARIGGEQTFQRQRLRPAGENSSRASAAEGVIELTRRLGAGFVDLELSAAGRFSSERVLQSFERYPVGGTKSLRGYDEQEFRVDRYGLSRLEWRRYLGPGAQRAFLFWDHAWMSTRLALPAGGDLLQVLNRDGVGVGLRVRAAGGLLGIEYGLEPGRPALEGKIHLQLISEF